MTTREARCPLCGGRHPVEETLFDIPIVVCPVLAGTEYLYMYQVSS